MKLRVWQTTKDVFSFMWRERQTLMRFAPIPVISTLLLGLAAPYVFGTDEHSANVADAVTGLFQTLIFLPLTVTWYRFVVMGPAETVNRPKMIFGAREWRLLGYQVAILAVASAIGLICASITQALWEANATASGIVAIVWTIAWVLSLLLSLVRMSMILVLAALDQPVSLKSAWRMTRGIAGDLLAASTLVVIGAGFIALIFEVPAVMTEPSEGESLGISHVLRTMGETTSVLLSVLGMTTLFGFVYLKLTDHAATETVTAEVVP